MRKISKIMSIEPPDLVNDPKVQEIICIMNLDVINDNKNVIKYYIVDCFNYFTYVVNVDMDEGDICHQDYNADEMIMIMINQSSIEHPEH